MCLRYLGYALTGYRAQGVTVDTGHVLVTGQSSRETLYVAMTRGRHANTAYIGLDGDTDQLRPDKPADARVVLAQVLQTSGAELSAHQVEQQEHARWNTIPQWAAEYKTILDATRSQRISAIVDPRAMPERRPGYVLGLVPKATGPMDSEYRQALGDLEQNMIGAAMDYLRQAEANQDAWLQTLGSCPAKTSERHRWTQTALTIAAYRASYNVTDDAPLGLAPRTPDQRIHRARVQQALHALAGAKPPPSRSLAAPPPAARMPTLGLW